MAATWENRTERNITLRSAQGRPKAVVREVYLRPDVPCHSPLCLSGCHNDGDVLMLPREATHYIVPDCQVSKDFLELFEQPEVQGVVFTQTAANCVQYEGSRKLSTRLRQLIQAVDAGATLLCNEFQMYAHSSQEPGESVPDWQIRSTFHAAEWLFDHLAGQIPVIMLTENEQAVAVYSRRKLGVLVLTLHRYLYEFLPGHKDIHDLYKSLAEVALVKNDGRHFSGYLPQAVAEEGLKSGRFLSGRLNVNRYNAATEAFVVRNSCGVLEEGGSDILIVGAKDRNRAVHGDEVVVEIYPRSQWRARSMIVKMAEESEDDSEDEIEDNIKENRYSTDECLPTGHVVAVLQRKWRDFIASVSPDEPSQKESNKSGKVLVIPWDHRIPKVRITTRQVDSLKDQRFVVRIDYWLADSQYPHGHVVRILGPIGDLETEMAALLVENEITASAFTFAQLSELPSDTLEQPWEMAPEEVRERRDLRQTHLVFSIDPKGCEDVDDTLSLRQLEGGHLELGVHIADVTFFVTPGSLTDKEAQGRSTTVYLADRRYDMLPAVLSANLCSLISGKDRYAVSVIWELTPDFKVINVWYGRTIIHSQYKLFYEMAEKICNGCSDSEIVNNVPELQNLTEIELASRLKTLRWTVQKLTELGRSLKARRTESGALELENMEVQIQLTETKKIEDLTPKEHLEVHETVAECMIFANHWVAKKISNAFHSKALLRNHPSPRQDQFDSLLKCAAAHGFHVDTSSNKALAASLNSSENLEDPVINPLLRSLATLAMSNARYFCTGSLPADQHAHYGLALDVYTHFTSPIRRYADVVVHRQLLAAVKKDNPVNQGPEDTPGLPGTKQLQEMAEHMNIKHRAAQNAQRDSQELFQAMFFRDHEDDNDVCMADAVIYQLRANGVMVYVPKYGVKGIAYLQDRSGQVLYIPDQASPQWVSGSLTWRYDVLTVTCPQGSQKYHLLDHITVHLSVSTSRAHCQSVRINVIAQQPESRGRNAPIEVTTKADIVKSVKKNADMISEDTRSFLEHLSPAMAEYRQTDPQLSLYTIFQSFREIGLTAGSTS